MNSLFTLHNLFNKIWMLICCYQLEPNVHHSHCLQLHSCRIVFIQWKVFFFTHMFPCILKWKSKKIIAKKDLQNFFAHAFDFVIYHLCPFLVSTSLPLPTLGHCWELIRPEMKNQRYKYLKRHTDNFVEWIDHSYLHLLFGCWITVIDLHVLYAILFI